MSAPLGQEDRVRRFFSDSAETWDALYGGRRNAFWRFVDRKFRRDIYARYQLTFQRLGTNLRGKTVLDIGCGSGVYCIEAARRGAAKVVGIDISENMIALARARSQELGYEDICEFVCTKFPPDRPVEALQRTVDFGIVMGVMDYVPNPVMFLKCARLLITQFVVLSFPGRHWLREPIRRYRYKLLGRCAVYAYEEQSIRDACAQADFRRVNIQRLDHSGICYVVTAYA